MLSLSDKLRSDVNSVNKSFKQLSSLYFFHYQAFAIIFSFLLLQGLRERLQFYRRYS